MTSGAVAPLRHGGQLKFASFDRAVGAASRSKLPRGYLWGTLVVLLLAALVLLVMLTVHYRATRTQELIEARAGTASAELAEVLARDLRAILALPDGRTPAAGWREQAGKLLAQRPELMRLERRDAQLQVEEAVDTRSSPRLFAQLSREQVHIEAELACGAAARRGGATYSNNYYVPFAEGSGVEIMDICIAERDGDRVTGFVVGSYSLPGLLDQLTTSERVPDHDVALVEADGERIAHGRVHVGKGVYVASRLVDLAGTTMLLRLDSAATRPSLLPDLVTSMVVALSLTLFGVVALLTHDVRKRARAESDLAEALAFRKAMEDSVVTGLRARDLSGRITYVNPAFCAMVQFDEEALRTGSPPPYWPPENVAAYQHRQDTRLASTPATHTREAFDTVFMRKNGERFPAMVFEAPLLDSAGLHAGWMSAILDLSAQRRVEEISRQQQERLQATARLATVGEMASLLSHEINQPLSAISAYATGSLNMMEAEAQGQQDDAELRPMLHQAMQRIAEQAERAGRVIKSVHDFVRRRENVREAVGVDSLVEAILPLIQLQARKSGTRIELQLPEPTPVVTCDRAMVEQVLLNLSRNGIQAMQDGAQDRDRVLTIRVQAVQSQAVQGQWIRFSVADHGPGVDDEVAKQLFTPFFTTRAEGMGLGLSVCRTIIEQHGGALDHENHRDSNGAPSGAEFRFTLPSATPRQALPKTAIAAAAILTVDP
ncbi:PAS domain S-box protein [soil metagenome]